MTPDAKVIPIHAQHSHERPRCKATTTSGRPCRNLALAGESYCRVHQRNQPLDAATVTYEDLPDQSPGLGDAVASVVEFVRKRFAGDYPVDDFGFDPELRTVVAKLADPLYRNYFRVRALGVNRIPAEGPALIVANHSGTIALDSLMVSHAVATEHPRRRIIRNMAADLVYRLPVVGPLARKTGNAVACDEDALELLRRGELLGVYPEGFKGVGKGWSERYRLQRFGRGGFVEIALKARAPIVPVAVVGAEEAYPMIGNARLLAKALGFPYFPVTPTFPALGPLGLLPLPSKWLIEFGDPISLEEYPRDAVEDPMLVFELADSIRDRIQQMLLRNLRLRGGAFV
jgi:1-acyl-sn-glycerol-3-phosphate acyltransferase